MATAAGKSLLPAAVGKLPCVVNKPIDKRNERRPNDLRFFLCLCLGLHETLIYKPDKKRNNR